MDLSIQDKQLKEQVADFKQTISKEAEQLIGDFFPRKCMELDSLLKEDFMQLELTTSIKETINLPVPDPIVLNHDETSEEKLENHLPASKKRKLATTVNEFGVGDAKESGTKVFVFPNGPVPCNSKILKIVNIIKPEICTLVEKCNTIRMWVTLLIPKIEDGNNFGVSIQEDTLSEIRQVESETNTFLDQISKYFVSSDAVHDLECCNDSKEVKIDLGQVVAKIAKYPHIADYRQFIDELDEKEFLSLRLIASELRNHYSGLQDMIIKNIEKIKKPRNSNIDGMY